MKFCIAIFLLSFVVFITACGPHKPAYENVKVETQSEQAAAKTAQAEQQNQAQETAGKVEENPAAKVAQEVQQSQQNQQNQQEAAHPKFQMPAFFDAGNGQIKDLPTYPKAKRANAQISNANDTPTVILVYQLEGKAEDAVAFYEKQFKANGWTVVTSSKTPDYYDWQLKKGERDQAAVNIRRDAQQPKYLILSVNRNQLPAAAK
jgi:hypothetical protein